MRIEIIKTKNGFRIPQLEKIKLSRDRFYAEIDATHLSAPTEKDAVSKTIEAVESALHRLGQNELLKLKLKHLPRNFTFMETETDEASLLKGLMEKYDK